jgi:hypothetical protein
MRPAAEAIIALTELPPPFVTGHLAIEPEAPRYS